MALEPAAVRLIEQLAPGLPNRAVLALGYPDILAAPNMLLDLPEAADANSVRKWHHWKHRVVSADAWFGSLGLGPTYWDIAAARGPEQIVDLNQPQTWPQTPDVGLLCDSGTLEHIWRIGDVWPLLAQKIALGGYVLHTTPFNLANHGFWSISPTAFEDFYSANGFAVKVCVELSGPLDNRAVRYVPAFKRYDAAPNCVIMCLAKRMAGVPLTVPVQMKYRANPMLKGQ